jgi:alkanesulfonate monooxygenase SsuD/methylene tetrahydromethanopterin reductase-like flavin-dependent oxidoreductase (luciferase family)
LLCETKRINLGTSTINLPNHHPAKVAAEVAMLDYKLSGKFWNISTERTYLPDLAQGVIVKPYQRPHPPIVVTAASPHSGTASAAAELGWGLFSANFLQPQWVATHWPKIVADPKDWRIAKSIFVADDAAVAERYAIGSDGPYYFYYRSLFTKLKANGRADRFKLDMSQSDDTLKNQRYRRPVGDPRHGRRSRQPTPDIP